MGASLCAAWPGTPPRERPQGRCSPGASTDSSRGHVSSHLSCSSSHGWSPTCCSWLGAPSGRTLCPCPSLGKEPDCEDLWALPLDGIHPLFQRWGPETCQPQACAIHGTLSPARQINSQAICLLPAQSRTRSELLGSLFGPWRERMSY